ncbi:protein NRT1/ PTR FAMILY 8.5 [Brachypodium distachyon]|uniref:Major facilitator superfamily (MFS) profile domain-containing protein n=1 Tax=Brachypodium distachyon TaxID=15368 RepID=I1GTQ1_BRADI|nr:protein NRT1/ PTR FAMILY 8.5 [Brachypodium distachyon]KQK15875.1 hypothetical protein BRADI_1g25460v3 [Brachypodium distachyon]|eukprot:XP_003562970.1 protein NRT1/ PTR FAMILY 8.5 [Brachypodium distachyon]
MASSGEQREHTVALLDSPAAEVEGEYTIDQSLDFDGNPALKHHTGGWRACRSVLATEFCYCLAYSGVSQNLVTYLTTVLRESNVAAAKNVSTWQATCFLTPIAGAVVADSYWGRYRTMVVSCSMGVAGLVVIALSANLPLLTKNAELFTGFPTLVSNLASAQESVLFLGLYMTAFGLGGLRPCLMSFGADQFDHNDPPERASKGSFFNWYVFTMSCASVVSSTCVVWAQDHFGWPLGLAIPAAVLAVGLACLVSASRRYRFQRTQGSPLTRVCQVLVAAVCKFNAQQPADRSLLYELPEDGSMKGIQRIEHTNDLQFFDKAAIVLASEAAEEEATLPPARNPWRLCIVTQVEELKILVRMVPVWASIVFYYAVSAQVSSTFVEQGMAMDTNVGPVRVPPASMSAFDLLTVVVLVPLYDRLLVPAARRLTGRAKGISDLQRIGAGLAMPALAMAAAALVETERLRRAPSGPAMSVLWQAPQYVLMGVGDVLATVGQLDFFYSQAPASMKTVCTALGFLVMAAGSYLSSFLLAAVEWATAAGGRPGWIPDDLDQGHLDRFFWMMSGLACLNLVAFGSCAVRYNSRKAS